MAATSHRLSGLPPTGSIPDRATCRRLEPLPGIVGSDIARLRASNAGSPYDVSPRHAVRNALRFHHDRILEALNSATTIEEIVCIEAQWKKLKADYERLLQEPLRYETEADGDEEVRNALLEILNPTILSVVIAEVVNDALRAEPRLSGREVAEAIGCDIAIWIASVILQMAESRSVRFFDRAIKRPSKRQVKPLAELIMDAARRVGVSITKYEASRIARRIMDQIRNPARLLSIAARGVATIYGSALIVALRLFLTPSRTVGRRRDEDENPALADAIERAISAAVDRIFPSSLRETTPGRMAPDPVVRVR